MNPGVYFLISRKTGEMYVGSTGHLQARRAQHFWYLREGKHHSSRLQIAYNEAPEALDYVIIPTETKALAQELEQLVLDELLPIGRLVNVAPNALNPAVGWIRSEELRKRMGIASSKALTGKPKSADHIEKMRAAQLGKCRSEETRRKMSLSRMGRALSDNHRQKLLQANLGRKMSSESIEKTRQANLGREFTDEHRLKLAVAGSGRVATVETRQKISESLTGRVISNEWYSRIVEASLTRAKCVVVHGLVFDSISLAATAFDIDPKTVTNRISNDKYPAWSVVKRLTPMNTNPVSNRVTGQFPLSVASSLALEGVVGIHPEHPEQTKNLLVGYSQIWVNLKTLFRNLYQAVDREAVLGVRPDELLDGFVSEVAQFEHLIEVLTEGKMKVTWYVSDYKNLAREYPRAIERGDTTNLQMAYSAAMKSTLGPWLRVYKDKAKTYDLKIKDYNEAKTLMLTHYAFDLLAPNFKNFDLLESHTGAIKPRHLWYTKYLNGKELSQLPFREDFLQIFGDSETFRPMAPGIKKQILEIAKTYNWSPISTDAKIEYGLNQLKDPFLRDILRSMR